MIVLPVTLPEPWLSADVLARYWSKVDRSGGLFACWPWTGGFNTPAMRPWKGTRRPIFRMGGAHHGPGQLVVYAHRLALAIHDGVPLWERDGWEACHTPECSNPACVNAAAHLYWGTPEENRRDRYGVEHP